jgi:hypothetical protein
VLNNIGLSNGLEKVFSVMIRLPKPYEINILQRDGNKFLNDGSNRLNATTRIEKCVSLNGKI